MTLRLFPKYYDFCKASTSTNASWCGIESSNMNGVGKHPGPYGLQGRQETETLIRNLIYSDTEMHLDIDENIFQKPESQVQEFIKGVLMESSQKMGRWGQGTEKNHDAEKPKSLNSKYLAKGFTMTEEELNCFQSQKLETEKP